MTGIDDPSHNQSLLSSPIREIRSLPAAAGNPWLFFPSPGSTIPATTVARCE
jgi:hypothetical protein